MSNASEQVHRFVSRIPRVRKARGMSQGDLASATGIFRQAIGKIENGQRGMSLEDALLISDALDVPLTDMLAEKPLALTVSVPID